MADITGLDRTKPDYSTNPVVNQTANDAAFWNANILNAIKTWLQTVQGVVIDEVTALQAEDTTLQANIDANTGLITSLTSTVSGHTITLSAQGGRLDTAEGNITAIDVRVTTLEGAVFGTTAYTSTSDPTADNDSADTAGAGVTFGTGALWINSSTGVLFLCQDATAAAAVWQARGSKGYEPTGFENQHNGAPPATLSISFVDATRTLTLTDSGGTITYWLNGAKKTVASPLSATISDVDGLHYVYIDSTGALVDDEAPPTEDLLRGVTYVALVYWNSTQGRGVVVGAELHGSDMNYATHNYLHNTRGAHLALDGGGALSDILASEDGSLDTHAQLSVAATNFHDEDIRHELSAAAAPANLPVLYRVGASLWYEKTADDFPFVQSGTAGYTGASGLPAYNEWTGAAWQLTEVPDRDFFLVHIFATHDYRTPFKAILGTSSYSTRPAAQSAARTELATLTGLPLAEAVPLGTVIYQVDTTYTNSVLARVIQTGDGGDYIDFRSQYSQSGVGALSADHGLLGGLADDDHEQYVLVTGRASEVPTVDRDPTTANELARKGYVDAVINGLDWQESVLDEVDFTASEPAAPNTGDRYINTATGVSSATAQSVTALYVYEWNGTDWTEVTPTDGFATWNENLDRQRVYSVAAGPAWVDIGATVTHNNLASIQGGTTGEHYHLTSAQHTVATQAAGAAQAGYVSTGAQAFGGKKTFNAGSDMNSQAITSVADPSAAQDAATKNYADGLISALGINDQTASGYFKLGGMLVQWGTGAASSAGVTFTFPTSFANTSYVVNITAQNQEDPVRFNRTAVNTIDAYVASGTPNIHIIAIGEAP